MNAGVSEVDLLGLGFLEMREPHIMRVPMIQSDPSHTRASCNEEDIYDSLLLMTPDPHVMRGPL